MKKKLNFLLLVLIFSIFIGGCSLPWKKKANIIPDAPVVSPTTTNATVSTYSGQMKKFTDYQEMSAFLEAQDLGSGLNDYARGGRELLAMTDMIASSESSAKSVTSVAANSVSTTDYSRTNVQVKGVDEADIIKTDGQYIYAVVYNELYVIQAVPADQAKAIAKITFASRPSEIYLHNGRLVVIGADEQIMTSSVYRNFRRQSPYTFVKIFDLSDPAAPKQIRDLDFEGSYQDSRVIAGRLYLIINNYNAYVAGESLVPRLVDGGKILSSDCSATGRCFAPDVYYFDAPYNSYNFTSINTLDLAEKEAPVLAQTYLLSDTQTIYVSAKNIFITYTQYLDDNDLRLSVMRALFTTKLTAADQARISKIDQADSEVLSRPEKQQKLMQFFIRFLDKLPATERVSAEAELLAALQQKYTSEAQNLERTVIHKFALGGDQPVYRANGSVPGTVLNQFSLDEDEAGNLRLATTRSSNFNALVGNQESYSNLYILSSDLKNIGAVENLAPGERIYSVRFLGKRAYLVTFKQTDPLFVLDLSNPQAPKLLGELKVPGFSNYLHPYDENTLIGLGRDTQTDVYGNVKVGGIKLSLFDVSDANNPSELDTYVAGGTGSDSLALYNHKAFLFSRDKNLLLIPASLTSVASNYRNYFSGALVFSIDQGKFNLRGQIDHSDGGKYQRSDYWCGSACYDNSVQRGLYIQDSLFTFSNKYLKVNSLADLSPLRAIKLTADTDIDLEIMPALEPPTISDSTANPSAGSEDSSYDQPVGPLRPPVTETTLETEASSSSGMVGVDNPVAEPELPIENASSSDPLAL